MILTIEAMFNESHVKYAIVVKVTKEEVRFWKRSYYPLRSLMLLEECDGRGIPIDGARVTRHETGDWDLDSATAKALT